MGYASASTSLPKGYSTIGQSMQYWRQHGDGSQIVWQPSNPNATDNSPQYWTNTQTGQQVFGQFDPGAFGLAKGGSIVGKGPNDGTLVYGDGSVHGNSLVKTLIEGGSLIAAPFAVAELTGGAAAGAADAGSGATEAGQQMADVTPGFGGGADAATGGATAASGDVVKNTITNMSGQPIDAAGNIAKGTSLLNNPWVKAAIGLGTSTGTALLQQHELDSAIDAAQKAQQQATQQALGINQQVYNTARSDYSPYMSIGRSATNTIGGLLGLDTGSGAGGNAQPVGSTGGYTPTPAPLPPILKAQPSVPYQPGATVSLNGGPQQSSSATTIGATVNGQQPLYAPGGATPMASTSNPMVLMRAPTGETSSVPASLVAHYQSMGAQILGGV